MVTRNQILAVLELLSEYYNRTLSNPQVNIYLRQLAHLDSDSLQEAAYDWINQSPFFPRVSELLQAAARHPPALPNYLELEEAELTRRFFVDGDLDREAWEHLATLFERSGDLTYANRTRRKLIRLQTEFDEDRHLKEQFKRKYLEWETSGQDE